MIIVDEGAVDEAARDLLFDAWASLSREEAASLARWVAEHLHDVTLVGVHWPGWRRATRRVVH